jgi:hypothetical protein
MEVVIVTTGKRIKLFIPSFSFGTIAKIEIIPNKLLTALVRLSRLNYELNDALNAPLHRFL